MERQLKNYLNDTPKPDNRPRVGRRRQESLALRRQALHEITNINVPPGFVPMQAGCGAVFASLWEPEKFYSVGSCTCQGKTLTVLWNPDSKGDQVRSLHDEGKLVFDSAHERGSVIARLKS